MKPLIVLNVIIYEEAFVVECHLLSEDREMHAFPTSSSSTRDVVVVPRSVVHEVHTTSLDLKLINRDLP